MESSRSRRGLGAGRAGAVVAIVAGLVALPPAFAGEDTSAEAPPPDADGILGNETAGPSATDHASPAPNGDAQPPPVATAEDQGDADPDAEPQGSDDAAKRGGCPNTNTPVNQLTDRQIRKSTGCLIDRERRQRNRVALDLNGKLTKAAEKHTKRMIRDDCFDHKCPGEPGLGKRIRRTGYLDGADKWRYAENLGCDDTTSGMVDAWLGDDFNRTNLLKRRYRDLGVGVEQGVPPTPPPAGTCPNDAATFTLVFAVRKG
jgi:uncharacterized protein YkwD